MNIINGIARGPRGLSMCAGPHQVWPLRSECCGRGVPTNVVCAEYMKTCCLGGKNSVVKGLKFNVLRDNVIWMCYNYVHETGI